MEFKGLRNTAVKSFPLTWKQSHAISGGEFASLSEPAELGWRDGVALAGQADGMSQDHFLLLRHALVVVVVLFISQAPGCFPVVHPLEYRRN